MHQNTVGKEQMIQWRHGMPHKTNWYQLQWHYTQMQPNNHQLQKHKILG